MRFEIFRETDAFDLELEDEMNSFFRDDNFKILSMNTVNEVVDDINYLVIVVCYEDKLK